MSLSKKQQDHLEVALANRDVKEAILNELQAMRDAYNALLAKLDVEAGTGTQVATYVSELEIESIREGGKKTRL